MLKNYLKIAFRSLARYKFISFINIFGLTLGITCCLLILVFVLNELSYDSYNKNAENIYRIERTFLNAETKVLSLELGAVAPPVAPLLVNDFKEIEKITRFLPMGSPALRYEDKKFNQSGVYFADENLFDVFDVNLTMGNPGYALDDPFTIILSEETARKFFGNANPLNKVIRLDNRFDFKVTGVFKALPANAHFHPQVMLSFNTLKNPNIYGEENLRTNWGNNSFYTYLLLPDGYDSKRLEAQFPAFLNRHIKEDYGNFRPSDGTTLSLRKLTDIHLYSHTDSEVEENGDIKKVYIFSAIGLFILLIACINYMNISTARSVTRAKEIGIRKVNGAKKHELVAQFLSEAVVLTFISTLLALILAFFGLMWLNSMLDMELSLNIIFTGYISSCMLLMPFVIGVLSGLYPAIFLSSFKPITVLKGMLKVGGGGLSFRKLLVITQFAISIILIISTVVVFRQLDYLQKKSLGFNKDHILILSNNAGLKDSFESFKTALLSNNNVTEVGRSSRIPSGRLLDANGSQISNGNSLAPTKADIKFVRVDEGFLSAYQINVKAGRSFSKKFGADTSSFLINEAAVKALGLKSVDEAIGKLFQYGDRNGTLAGVINDFHFESLHQRILPLVLFQSESNDGYSRISIKISGQNLPATLRHIENIWKHFLPEIPYEYSFLDERFAELYKSEKSQGEIFTVFSFIAIFIACLGLFGLSAFSISQRIKEIGIRKVLGASIQGIVALVSQDFLKLVLVSAVIAFPIAWWAMNSWLSDFAYRISISWWIFILAAVIAVLIAFFTISLQALKAAATNPVKSLRSE